MGCMDKTLEQQLAYHESQVEALKEQLENQLKIDESYIGHVVEVSESGKVWYEQVLGAIARGGFPFETTTGTRWEKARPRTKGPSVGHWIEHAGSPMSPTDSKDLVVVEHIAGGFYANRVNTFARFDWEDIKRYAIIKIG